MAAATATLTVNAYPNGVDNTQRRQLLFGICALSAGGTYVTNGIPLNWAKLVDGNTGTTFVPQAGPQTTQPQTAWFWSTTAATGYTYIFDTVHNTLRIYNGGTELANAASITADTIAFNAEYVRGV